MSQNSGGDDPFTTVGKRVGGFLKDTGYAIGSGNWNSWGQSLLGGEGTIARATREGTNEAKDKQEQADKDAAAAYDAQARERIDAFGKIKKATPGIAATLLSQNYGQGAKGTLLTPTGS